MWDVNGTLMNLALYIFRAVTTYKQVYYKAIYCKCTIYFCRHNNIMIYLLNFNITYVIILAICFDSYELSSGINFQELLYILFYSFYVLV